MKIDGILLEVIGNTFMSIAEEMGSPGQVAYSTNIKERRTAPARCSTRKATPSLKPNISPCTWAPCWA